MNYPMYNGFSQMPTNQPMMPNNQQYVQSNQQQYVPLPQPTIVSERTSIPIQQNAIIPIESEEVARSQPTAPGNTVIMKDKDGIHLYVKSMPISMPMYQVNNEPVFEIYVKEEEKNIIDEPKKDDLEYITKDDLEPMFDALDNLREQMKDIKGSIHDSKKTVRNAKEK